MGYEMKTKSFTLFSYKENNIQTYIQCTVKENASFHTKGNILHVKSNVKINNQKRRERYKLNKEREEKLTKDLDWYVESIEKNKWLEKEGLRIKLNKQEIDMDSELEDMESYY